MAGRTMKMSKGGLTVPVVRSAFRNVWAGLGWTAAPDNALTDPHVLDLGPDEPVEDYLKRRDDARDKALERLDAANEALKGADVSLTATTAEQTGETHAVAIAAARAAGVDPPPTVEALPAETPSAPAAAASGGAAGSTPSLPAGRGDVTGQGSLSQGQAPVS